MKNKIIVLLLSFAMLACILPSQFTVSALNTTYYIDTAGSNGNSGTSAGSPWADFTNINNMTLQPGDTVLLKRNCIWNQKLEIAGSGTSANWITIDAYGSGAMPKISRNGDTPDRCVWLSDTDYVSLSNLEICNAGVGLVAYFTTNNHYGLKITDCYFHDIFGFKGGAPAADHTDLPGLYFSSSILVTGEVPVTESDYAIQQITVDSCDFYIGTSAFDIMAFNPDPNGQQGFLSTELGTHTARDVVYKNCNVVKTGFFNFCNLQDAKIISNRFEESGYDNANGCGGFFWSVQDAEVSNCIINNHTNSITTGGHFIDNAGIDFEAFDDSITVQGSMVADNAGPGMEILAIANSTSNFQTNHVFSGNVFMNNAKAENTRYESGLWLDNYNRTSFSGTVSDNLYYEPTGIVTNSGAGSVSYSYNNNRSFSVRSSLWYAAEDFATVQNENDWNYEYNSSGTYYSLNYDSSNNWWGNLNGYVTPFNMFTSSDNTIWLCRTWEAPASSTISIRGVALKNDISGGDGVKVRITKNGTTIWPAGGGSQTIAYNDNTGYATNLDSINVSQGDKIRFEVNNGGSGSNTGDLISWSPSVGISGTLSNSTHTSITVSSEYSADYRGTNAIDHYSPSVWKASTSSFPQYITYDLGKSFALNTVTTEFWTSDTWRYKIEGSNDGSSWTTLVDKTSAGVSAVNTMDSVAGSYRYVKLTITGSNSNPAGIAELEIYKDTGYLTLLSSGKTVTTSSSSGPNFTGAKAVDNSDATYWCASSGSFPQWLTVDLGNSYVISNVGLEFITLDTWKYKIEGSNDNSTWTMMWDDTGTGVYAQDKFYSLMNCFRYVRITLTDAYSNWAALAEIKIFGSPVATALVSQGKTATCSSYTSFSYNAAKAVDGNAATYWCASGGTMPQWLTVDLGDVYTVTNIWTSFYQADGWHYKIEGSLDSNSWTLLTDSYDGGYYNNNPEYHSILPLAGSYRYVRITIMKSLYNWACLKEFQIYALPLLSQDKTAAASTYSEATYAPAKALDGSTSTFWCASSGSFPQWLTVDLGDSYELTTSTVTFYASEIWKYTIEGSNDNSTWAMLLDNTSAGTNGQTASHGLEGSWRYVRITITYSSVDWAAIREFKLYGYLEE